MTGRPSTWRPFDVAESAERTRLRRAKATHTHRAEDARHLHRLALQADLLAEAAMLEESHQHWTALARRDAERLRALGG